MRDSGLAHILSISGLRFTSRASQFGRSRLPRRGAAGHGCGTVWSSKGRHPCRLQATTQPTPISDWAAIQKNKDQ